MKWVGGKQAIAQRVIEHFPATFSRYYEPFVGGGAIFFELAPAHAVLGDGNSWLIDTYESVRDNWRAVARLLDGMVNTREEYLRIRGIAPETLAPVARAAHFIYLNKTCFRGLFRVNQRGQFNVPYGAYDRRYYGPDELRDAAAALHGVELRRGDFELGLDGVSTGDFVYFDPPYYKLGGYSDFNRYTKDQFVQRDHERLAERCRALDRGDVRFVLSNSDTPLVRELYQGFAIRTIAARREIQLDPTKRAMVELVITNACS